MSKEQIEKQAIDEIAREMCHLSAECETCQICDEKYHCDGELCYFQCIGKEIINHKYRKQREGEWISNELGGYQYAFHCSECGWVDGYPFNDRHKYCPNCGAKMKGGAE